MIRISDAEFEVMQIIWDKKEATSQEIINELKDNHDWNDNTVRTLINRLVTKKAIEVSKKNGKTYTYAPLIAEGKYKVKRSKGFIGQFFKGSMEDMLFELVSEEEMSLDDLEVLMDKVKTKFKQ